MTVLPEMFSPADEDASVDLSLSLVDLRPGLGTMEFIARGSHEGRSVGFAATLHGDWGPEPLEGMNANLFWGRVSLKSLGAESDAFLAALRSLYGFPPSPSPMKVAIEFTAAGLGDDPRAVASQPVKIKLFYEPPGSESEGAEVYLNIDATRSLVEFNEKDEGYRGPLLAALTAEPLGQAIKPWWKLW